MGATNFTHSIFGYEDMDDAYQAAVSEAEYDFGNDPYNGTISTTGGVQLSPLSNSVPTPIDEVDYAVIDKRLDKLSKWDNCEAIRVCNVKNTTDHKRETTRTLTFTIPMQEVYDLQAQWEKEGVAVNSTVTRAAKSLAHDHIDSLLKKNSKKLDLPAIKKDEHWGFSNFHSKMSVEFPERKFSTVATQGNRVTEYYIVNSGRFPLPTDTAYESQAEARKNLPTPNDCEDAAQWEIMALTRRENGEGLVKHTPKPYPKSAKVKITAQIVVSPVKRVVEKDRTGWMFYGWAAC